MCFDSEPRGAESLCVYVCVNTLNTDRTLTRSAFRWCCSGEETCLRCFFPTLTLKIPTNRDISTLFPHLSKKNNNNTSISLYDKLIINKHHSSNRYCPVRNFVTHIFPFIVSVALEKSAITAPTLFGCTFINTNPRPGAATNTHVVLYTFNRLSFL